MVSEKTRKKISKGLKIYYQTHEHSNKGGIVSEERKEKIRKTLTGRKNGPPSIETRRRISEANKGRKRPDLTGDRSPSKRPEVRKRMSNARIERKKRLGYINSPETIEKIRQANILRFSNPIERQRISQTLTGRIGVNKGKHWKVADTTKMKLASIKRWKNPEYRDNQMLKMATWSKRENKETGIEKKLRLSLTKYKINFERYKSISFLRTIPDFFIKPNIAVYADGNYWHSLPYVKKRDKRIFRDLVNNGYIVFRISEDEINNNSDWCANVIKKLV